MIPLRNREREHDGSDQAIPNGFIWRSDETPKSEANIVCGHSGQTVAHRVPAYFVVDHTNLVHFVPLDVDWAIEEDLQHRVEPHTRRAMGVGQSGAHCIQQMGV